MLIFVCALKCEALSLIQHFCLKIEGEKTLFPIYKNDSLFLIQSGVGKIAAAAAVSYLYARLGEPVHSAWINIGVGGHSLHPIGSGYYAHKIVDLATNHNFYPTLTRKETVLSETVFTVDAVESTFAQNGIYEMEAAGFCKAASLLTTAELMHCYKVISDNQGKPPIKDSQFIQGLIESHLHCVESLVNYLLELQKELNEENTFSLTCTLFKERWHFTQTELFQLQRLLQRWEILSPEKPALDETFNHCKKAKDVLTLLNQKLCFL